MATLGRLLRLVSPGAPRTQRVFDGFVDSLLQAFENHRAGLRDEDLAEPGRVAEYFEEIYRREKDRLHGIVEASCTHLDAKSRAELRTKTDSLIRRVVIPAYSRLAGRFSIRERNDFYATPDALHGVERVGWGVAGLVLGAFVVWAPFIPLWSKEWVAVFALGGLVFPNIRRYLALRRYASDLNAIVARADDEIWRMDVAYMTSGTRAQAPSTVPEVIDEETPAVSAAPARDRQAPEFETRQPRAPIRQGGR